MQLYNRIGQTLFIGFLYALTNGFWLSPFLSRMSDSGKGPSIKYVSIFEGGGVSEMLTLADMGEGGYLKC